MVAYFEDVARAAVLSRSSDWNSSRKPNQFIMCLMAAYYEGFDTGNETELLPPTFRPFVKHAVSKTVEKEKRQYLGIVANNKVIKAANLRAVLLPIGIQFDLLDPEWFADIDAFGAGRGKVAYSTHSVVSLIDPRIELETVAKPLVGVGRIDDMVTQLQG
jgi:hypothetical protein